MRLLLVEDNESHSALMNEQLAGIGAEVVSVDTVAAAIQQLGVEPAFDLAVLDQELPDGSGFEVQDFLSEVSNPTPVLFVTSDDHAEHAVRAMKRGASGYVVKRPEYLAELIKEVTLIVNRHTTSTASSRSQYDERERTRLSAALQRNAWNVSATARDLGIGRGMLRNRMSTLGLDE